MPGEESREEGPRNLVAAVNARTGSRLKLVGVAEHGETGGAAYVRWPDGRAGVVTHVFHRSIEQARHDAEVLALLRSRGLPVPRHDLLVDLGGGTVAVVQERLPGSPAKRTDPAVIEAMVTMNERFAGLLADRPDVPIRPLHLRESGPVFPRHETLAEHSDRSRRMLRLIREIGSGEPHEMVGDDLVHVDFTVPNVLFDDAGQITGVVDWNLGLARGDRRFGLIKLYFDLTWALATEEGRRHVDPAALDRLNDVLEETLEPDVLRLYWAHWTLYQLHWAIRSGEAYVIDLHLDLGESRLG
ncbi:phosphotransferase [Actinopolymorpha pittospori]